MERFPMLVTAGAALLGYVAGEMAVDDIALHDHIVAHAAWLETVLPIACAIFVVAMGKLMAGRKPTAAAPASLDRGAASSPGAPDLQPETAR